MAANRGSESFWWLLIGILLGVAGTIGTLMYLGGDFRGRHAAVPLTTEATQTVPHKPARLRTAAGSAAQDTDASTDQQVAEDAAAAGMTSRTHNPDDPGR